MWPEILGLATNLPVFNYGKHAAGNKFILNQIILANKKHRFTENDLVIVKWTICDRRDYFYNNSWHHFPNAILDKDQQEKQLYDINGHYIDQLPLISSGITLLDTIGCTVHHTSYVDLSFTVDDTFLDNIISRKLYDSIFKTYSTEVDRLLPGIGAVIFDHNYNQRISKLEKIFTGYFMDAHPYPSETLRWLQTIFDFDFSPIENTVHKHNDQLIHDINRVTDKPDYVPRVKEAFPGLTPEDLDYHHIKRYLYPQHDTDDISWHTIRNGGLPTPN